MKKAAVAGVTALSIAGGSLALAAAMPIGAVLAQESGSSTTTTPPADPAHPKGRGLDAVLGSLVADGTITQPQADAIKKRVAETAAKAREGFADKRDAVRQKFGAKLDEIAGFLGLTTDDLKTQLKTKSLGEIAGDKKAGLITFLTDAVNARVDGAVTAGKITKEQADKVKAETASRVAKMVDMVGGGKGPLGHPHRGRGR